MTARGLLTLGAAVAAMLAAAAPAAAALEPFVFGVAKEGQLTVSSSVLVGNRTVEMMGGWTNDSQPCSRERRLDVDIIIDRVRGGTTTRHTAATSGLVENCAEGGPNFGFRVRAADIGMACPDGSWRRGHYTFNTETLHRGRGVRAIASLLWVNRDPC